MNYPNFAEEKKLWKKGFNFVVGLDEAGRGPLAGPVVAGAVAINTNYKIFTKIRDSKQLSEKNREEIYEFITNCADTKWGIGVVSEKVIDKINILEATKLAMKNAVSSLREKSEATPRNDENIFLLIDGNFKLDFVKSDLTKFVNQKSIIKGDQKVFSIAAASIIAKVTRDRIMQKYHKKFPNYGFDKHKGYGTALHIKNIEKFGACKIHRKTFYPVSAIK